MAAISIVSLLVNRPLVLYLLQELGHPHLEVNSVWLYHAAAAVTAVDLQALDRSAQDSDEFFARNGN